MKYNEIKNKGTVNNSESVVKRKNVSQNRLPVYMSNETKECLIDLRITLYHCSGKWISLTQIVRDAIEMQLNHEDELIQKYME